MITAESIQSIVFQLIANVPVPVRDSGVRFYFTTWRENRARRNAMQMIARRYREYANSLFDDHFLRNAGKETLNLYLSGSMERQPAAGRLAQDWYEQLERPAPVNRKHGIADVTMAADDLLSYLKRDLVNR